MKGKDRFTTEGIRVAVRSANAQGGQRYLLTRSAVAELLEAFLSGMISESDVVDWADYCDANEYIELETGDLLPDVLFELSAPEINGLLDRQRAAELVNLLRASSYEAARR